jgi:hypothetical protein
MGHDNCTAEVRGFRRLIAWDEALHWLHTGEGKVHTNTGHEDSAALSGILFGKGSTNQQIFFFKQKI